MIHAVGTTKMVYVGHLIAGTTIDMIVIDITTGTTIEAVIGTIDIIGTTPMIGMIDTKVDTIGITTEIDTIGVTIEDMGTIGIDTIEGVTIGVTIVE